MNKVLGITLGIMTALGGFVDLGQIVFTTQAGALFSYQLMWAIVLGTGAIIVYMEMCGRVAVVAKEPVFAVVRTRLGWPLGLATLIASNLLNLITCAAELGGLPSCCTCSRVGLKNSSWLGRLWLLPAWYFSAVFNGSRELSDYRD
jgi:manganese transport protein